MTVPVCEQQFSSKVVHCIAHGVTTPKVFRQNSKSGGIALLALAVSNVLKVAHSVAAKQPNRVFTQTPHLAHCAENV